MADRKRRRTKAKQPTKGQRQLFMAEYPFPWCRVLGHDWKAPRHNQLVTSRGHVEMRLTCERCSTRRTDYISLVTGEVEDRTYTHPKGYLTDGWGEYVPSRSEWRRTQLRAMVERKSKVRAAS